MPFLSLKQTSHGNDIIVLFALDVQRCNLDANQFRLCLPGTFLSSLELHSNGIFHRELYFSFCKTLRFAFNNKTWRALARLEREGAQSNIALSLQKRS